MDLKKLLNNSTMKFLNMFAAHVKSYPINKSLKYSYSLGFLISFLIVIQIVSGIFLSAFYVPYAQFASQSVDYIVNEVTNGYIIQRFHFIIDSFIFILVYLHFIRAFYYKMFQ